jgi:hypothetical protein
VTLVVKPTVIEIEDKPPVELTVSPDTVCFIILKAREFDVKDEVTEPDPGSNPTDDGDIEVLEDHGDDPAPIEIAQMIGALSIDERADLVALAWVGRGDYDVKDFATARRDAVDAHERDTARYLLGLPLLGDYLEEGLSQAGRDCEEIEFEHL